MDIKKKNYSTIRNLLFMTKEMLKLDPTLAIIVFLGALASVGTQYALLYLPKIVIDHIDAGVDWPKLITSVALLCAAIFLFRVIDTWCGHHRNYRFMNIRMSMILKKVHKTNTMNYEYLENPEIMNLSQLAHSALTDYEGVTGLMNRVYYVFIDLVKMIASITLLASVNWMLIVIVIGMALIHFIFFNRNIVNDKKYSWDKLAPLWRRIYYMNDVNANFSYGKDIRLQNMEHFLHRKQKEVNQEAHHYIYLSKRRWGTFGVFTNFINSVMELALYWILIIEFLNNRIFIADFILYIGLVFAFFHSLSGFLYGIANTRRCSLKTNDYRTFMEMDEKEKPARRSISEIKRFTFEFKDVSFQYPNQSTYALQNLSIKLEEGSRLAVVGLNGAGKTTFVKLLLRLYEPQSGGIYVDGIPINEFDRNEYYLLFAPLFQEINVLGFPIAENISMRTPSKTDKDLAYDCLCLAGLEDKIKQLDKGIDTELLKIIDEEGIDLSGGEKQKIALARALYKASPVVVLDEPTSALDALAEYQLYQDFDRIIQDKTAVYISHRLSSTRFCHQIAMFKDGSMIEYGTHAELTAKGGEYKHMYDIQAQYYQEEAKHEE